MMHILAKTDSILEAGLGILVAVLPLLFVGTFFLWVIRLVMTLRERLDAIEDKLELVLMHLEQAKTPSTSKTEGSKPSE